MSTHLGAQQSHPSYTGFAWYRRRICRSTTPIPRDTKSLAVLIPVVQDAYEIYWNGQKLGTYGMTAAEGANWWAFGHDDRLSACRVPVES